MPLASILTQKNTGFYRGVSAGAKTLTEEKASLSGKLFSFGTTNWPESANRRTTEIIFIPLLPNTILGQICWKIQFSQAHFCTSSSHRVARRPASGLCGEFS
ncbi:hypothetical protein BaRGS_00027613 [Batillaria attramentaria]|uniref:Uncharacterized protein n=1 Tax=Batillaria attramentaria TaxID=370345 RepID=A0ABD0K2U7_9CAEN